LYEPAIETILKNSMPPGSELEPLLKPNPTEIVVQARTSPDPI
ncbi:MAG: hypothetical protein QOJ85_4058, partial [Solirubrobacteraceae bacterium]|nr:hypothetical protein [Solirubrobacteraceae bacterium]